MLLQNQNYDEYINKEAAESPELDQQPAEEGRDEGRVSGSPGNGDSDRSAGRDRDSIGSYHGAEGIIHWVDSRLKLLYGMDPIHANLKNLYALSSYRKRRKKPIRPTQAWNTPEGLHREAAKVERFLTELTVTPIAACCIKIYYKQYDFAAVVVTKSGRIKWFRVRVCRESIEVKKLKEDIVFIMKLHMDKILLDGMADFYKGSQVVLQFAPPLLLEGQVIYENNI